MLVDVKHEVSLAYKITNTKAGDGETLPDLLTEAKQNLPESRIETLALRQPPPIRPKFTNRCMKKRSNR